MYYKLTISLIKHLSISLKSYRPTSVFPSSVLCALSIFYFLRPFLALSSPPHIRIYSIVASLHLWIFIFENKSWRFPTSKLRLLRSRGFPWFSSPSTIFICRVRSTAPPWRLLSILAQNLSLKMWFFYKNIASSGPVPFRVETLSCSGRRPIRKNSWPNVLLAFRVTP